MERNILIIDDDEMTRETLFDILDDEGHGVFLAENAEMGLNLISKGNIQVALVDIKLPDMDGIDLLEKILSIAPDIYVVIITGYASLDNALRALHSRVYAYLCKPIHIEEVKAILKKIFQQIASKEREHALEQEVRKMMEKLDAIFNSLPAAILIFNQDHEVEYINTVFLKEFSQRIDHVLGKKILDLLPLKPSDSIKLKKDLVTFFKTKKSRSDEVIFGKRIFRYRIFQVVKTAIDGDKCGLLLWNVTQEKKLQQDLNQSEKLAGIGLIVTGIAHEINNPLQGIMGLGEAIADEENIEVIKQYTADLVSYTKDASDIVTSLVTYSRAAKETELELVDMNLKLKDALKISKHSVGFDGIEVVIVDHKVPLIRLNPGEIQQVIVNIVNNSVQAMQGKGRLTLSTGYADKYVIIRINDTGQGIPKKNLEKIYDPFFTTKNIGCGTGLGLNIAYRIVTKYGGKIEVETEEGKGTTFIIKLPIT